MPAFRRALITGSTSGIGSAFCEALPGSTHLLVTGRDPQRLEQARTRLLRPGRQVEAIAADLARGEDVDRLIDAAERFGVDLLINNAGVGRFGAILSNPVDGELDTVRINVLAVVALTRRLLPGMLQRAKASRRRAGLIIVASTAAFLPVPYFATYGASKAFLMQFGEALAEELRGEPIDVLVLCPGATRTAFGSRAGYDPGNLPGAADPNRVARDGLNALGREIIHVTGSLSQAALAPFIAPRRLLTSALGVGMRALVSARRSEAP